MKPGKVLVHVDAPHFCAGLILDETGTCIEAAPILRWSLGWRWVSIALYFEKKGWRWMIRPDPCKVENEIRSSDGMDDG